MVKSNVQMQTHTNCGNGCDDLSQLELVQDGSLTSSIKTYHKNTHLFLGKEPAKKFGERQPHLLFQLDAEIHDDKKQQHQQ